MADNLSEEQITEFKNAFFRFANEKGYLTESQFHGVMKILGTDVDFPLIENDHQEGSYMDINEFLFYISRKMQSNNSNLDLTEAFRVYDPDKSGFIGIEDFKEALASVGEKLTEDEFQELINAAELGGDGRINYEHFMRMVG